MSHDPPCAPPFIVLSSSIIGSTPKWEEGIRTSWTERMRELYGDKLTEAQVVMYIVLWYSYGTIVVCSVSSVACSANEDFTNS